MPLKLQLNLQSIFLEKLFMEITNYWEFDQKTSEKYIDWLIVIANDMFKIKALDMRETVREKNEMVNFDCS